jgi:hypothetical protein
MSQQSDFDPQAVITKLEKVRDGSLRLFTKEFDWPYEIERIHTNQGHVTLQHPEYGTIVEPLSSIYDVYHFTKPQSRQQTFDQYSES